MKHRSAAKKVRRRLQIFKRTKQKLGLPPGTPVHVGEVPDFVPYINFHRYDENEYSEHAKIKPQALQGLLRDNLVNWVDVEGVHDVQLIRRVSELFDIHPLTQEDIVNTNHRPQFETYPGYFFVTLKMLYLTAADEAKTLQQEQVSIVIRGNTVISFQEKPGDVFLQLRERLRTSTGRLRSRGSDYLAYSMLDAIVDSYYQVVDHIGEKIEALEDEIRFGIKPSHLERIYDLKHEIVFLRKNIIPMRDVTNKLQTEGTLFNQSAQFFLRDLSDHVLQVAEAIGTFTEMINVLVDTYHSLMNQKMNGIMKVLTMFSTIFLPLNFLAGIYGMNFEHMPELSQPWAYPTILIMMLFIVLAMLFFFWRKRWIFEERRNHPKRLNGNGNGTGNGPHVRTS